MKLILKVDGDGYPHVGGVRWSGEELLHNYYESIHYNTTENFYYYQFDQMQAEIHAFDELAIVTDLTEKDCVLLGEYEASVVSPLFLDFKSRPIIFVECNNTVIRALVSNAAYYDFVTKTELKEELYFWWEIEEVVQEREDTQHHFLIEQLVKRASEFLHESIHLIPPGASWIFHPLHLEGDVQFIAQQGHQVLCCEPQSNLFQRRIKLDEEKLLKVEQDKIEYFNNQFAPEDRTFDVFFDHGLFNHVNPADRQNFFEYIKSVNPKYFFGTVMISYDFAGPPYGFTEKEFYEGIVSKGFEAVVWKRNGSYLNYLLERK